jgi:hypothetical protein
MTRIQAVLGVAATFALGCASAAAAGDLGGATAPAETATAIDVPTQVFAQDKVGAQSVVQWKPGADLTSQARNWAVGRSLRVDVPMGAKARLPLIVHVYSSEEVCHDNMDFTAAAAVRNQEQDFIRGGDH